MLNGDIKKEALKRLEDSQNENTLLLEDLKKKSLELFFLRKRSSEFIVREVKKYMYRVSNIPKRFHIHFVKYENLAKFFISEPNQSQFSGNTQVPSNIDIESNSGKVAGIGAAAGVGVGVFGPTAAMAIASTFGTASTGAAIASLSGAAATNAAAAWLGGGALAAGGGGIAGGSTLLGAMGPIGWVIGGGTLLYSGFSASKKNLEIAKAADIEREKINQKNLDFKGKLTEIDKLISLTSVHVECQKSIHSLLVKFSPNDYFDFTTDDKDNLQLMGIHIQFLSKLLGRTVSD